MDAGVRATQEQLPRPQALAAGEGPAHRFFSELLLLSPVRAEPVEAIFSSDHQDPSSSSRTQPRASSRQQSSHQCISRESPWSIDD